MPGLYTPTLAQEDAAPIQVTPDAYSDPGLENGTLEPADGLGPDGAPARGPDNSWSFLMIIAVFMLVMILFSTNSQRKEKKKREHMLAAVKKGDKVQTIGGILASVVELREHDVILKIDENANTRVRFARSAIQSVTSEQDD